MESADAKKKKTAAYRPTPDEDRVIARANRAFVIPYITTIALATTTAIILTSAKSHSSSNLISKVKLFSIPADYRPITILSCALVGEITGRTIGKSRAKHILETELPESSELRRVLNEDGVIKTQASRSIFQNYPSINTPTMNSHSNSNIDSTSNDDNYAGSNENIEIYEKTENMYSKQNVNTNNHTKKAHIGDDDDLWDDLPPAPLPTKTWAQVRHQEKLKQKEQESTTRKSWMMMQSMRSGDGSQKDGSSDSEGSNKDDDGVNGEQSRVRVGMNQKGVHVNLKDQDNAADDDEDTEYFYIKPSGGLRSTK